MTRISSRSGTRPISSRIAAPDDRADRLLLVERRQDEADRQALLLLELDEAPQVGELGVVEVRLAEPALDAGRDGAGLLGGAVGGGERLGPRGELLERLPADGLAGLDDDDRRLAPAAAIASGSAPKRYASPSAAGRLGRRAHDDEVGLLGLAQDRVADVGASRRTRLAVARGGAAGRTRRARARPGHGRRA